MRTGKVEIKELRLRVSGVSRSEAKHLGELVAKRIAQLAPRVSRSQRIPKVHISVRDQSSEGIANAVAKGIRSRVR
ncbi:MAG TPA: hypothetical protein VLA93_22165 [Pyrinomonadaceae bacterium]|nr:hypothetical protein [Pyrinomonadaceae bacterium]